MSTPKENLSLVPSTSTNQQFQTTQSSQMSLSEIEKLSIHFRKSGLFGIGEQGESQAVVRMLAGNALGIDPFSAMKEIYIISGKLQLSAHMMACLIEKHNDYDYEIVEHTEQICSINFYKRSKRTGQFVLAGNSNFTMEKAKKAGLVTDAKLYNKYTENMLYCRAMSNGAKWFCPRVFSGSVYAPGEIPEQQPEEINVTKVEFLKQLISLDKMANSLDARDDLGDKSLDYDKLTLNEIKLHIDTKSKSLIETLKDKLLLLKVEPAELTKLTLVQLYTKYNQLYPEQPF